MARPRPLTQDDYRGLAEVRREIRKFLNFSEAAAREAGIEPQQHQLLLAIKGLDAGTRPTIRALADWLQIQHHSAVELVGRSADRGLVTREPGRRDRREVTVRITPRGQRLLRKLSLAHREELGSAARVLIKALEELVRNRTPKKR